MEGVARGNDSWWVICLCAGWCGVCREWRTPFEQAARDLPDVKFAWVDVEDEAESMGDVDIETFPTVMIAHGPLARFLGPVQPSPQQLARLVESLQAQQDPKPAGDDAQGLLQRLRVHVLPAAPL
jgi:thioredoxin 1